MKILSLLLKILLIIIFIFLFLSCIPVPALIVPTLVLLVLTIFLWKRATMFTKLPILTINAKVISKNLQVIGAYSATKTRYFITFELENGTRKIFITPIQIYGIILENENGVLSYKEHGKFTKFIDFKK